MMDLGEIEKLPICFIVGKGRSGTTLLQTMLDANSNVVFPIESRFVVHLKVKYSKIPSWTENVVDEMIVDLFKDKDFAMYWNLEPATIKTNIMQHDMSRMTFASACKIIYLSYPSPFPKSRILLIGDKNPSHTLLLKELNEVFPEARYIHLVRDFRDNIVSNKQVFKRQSITLLATGWNAYNKLIEAAKKQRPQKFYTLRYEDLVKDPERYVAEVCTFLGLKFQKEMMSFHEKMAEIKEEKYTAEITAIHPNIVKPVNTDQVNKWQKYLSDEQLKVVDQICSAEGKKYGYNAVSGANVIVMVRELIAGIRIHIDFAVIRTYYRMPFMIRDAIRAISRGLYKIFRFSTYYNQGDFRFKK
jgi:hypothetical protein